MHGRLVQKYQHISNSKDFQGGGGGRGRGVERGGGGIPPISVSITQEFRTITCMEVTCGVRYLTKYVAMLTTNLHVHL